MLNVIEQGHVEIVEFLSNSHAFDTDHIISLSSDILVSAVESSDSTILDYFLDNFFHSRRFVADDAIRKACFRDDGLILVQKIVCKKPLSYNLNLPDLICKIAMFRKGDPVIAAQIVSELLIFVEASSIPKIFDRAFRDFVVDASNYDNFIAIASLNPKYQLDIVVVGAIDKELPEFTPGLCSYLPSPLFKEVVIFRAAFRGNLSVLMSLLNFRDFRLVSLYSRALNVAASTGHLHIIEYFSQALPDFGRYIEGCLKHAAMESQIHIIQFLLQWPKLDADLISPTIIIDYVGSIGSPKIDILESLLSIVGQKPGPHWQKALTRAIQVGNVDVVAKLLENHHVADLATSEETLDTLRLWSRPYIKECLAKMAPKR